MQRTQNYNLVKIDLTDSPPDITVLNPNFDTIVDKAEGKQLSTEDYTTVEKNKLAGIADNANNYTHPPTHSANEITEEVDKRFLTDAERNKLTAIQDGANNYVHPESHPAAIITEDETHRFLTDVERNKLNGIAEGANSYTHPPTHSANEITEEVDKKFMTDDEKATVETAKTFLTSGGTINGPITVNDGTFNGQVVADRVRGNTNSEIINIGTGNVRIDANGGNMGIYATADVNDTSIGVQIINDGTVRFLTGGQSMHEFANNGTASMKGNLTVTGDITASTGTTGRVIARSELIGNMLKGYDAHDRIGIGVGNCRVDTTSGIMRLFTSALGGGIDNGILINQDGSLTVKCNNINQHTFHADGQKTAGTMEIDGTVYGMSPTDSPQTLIEYLEYDINVEGEKVIKLDHIYKKMISKYAVFSSNPDIKIVEKTSDYFKVQGNGIADFVIKGQRKGADEYFRIMGGLEHGVTEEQTN